MKMFLALALSLLSLNVVAQTRGATEKFTSYLPLGSYTGSDDQGVECQVDVSEVNFPKKDIQVRVVSGKNNLTKLIEENSHYGYKDYKREFVQTERSLVGADDSSYVERIVRTVSAGDNKQYVVVSYSVVHNRERNTDVAECVVDL